MESGRKKIKNSQIKEKKKFPTKKKENFVAHLDVSSLVDFQSLFSLTAEKFEINSSKKLNQKVSVNHSDIMRMMEEKFKRKTEENQTENANKIFLMLKKKTEERFSVALIFLSHKYLEENSRLKLSIVFGVRTGRKSKKLFIN